jgi:acetoin utilization protein AcuB
MLVKNWMSKDVVSIAPDDSMHDAMGILKKKNISFLPVMENDELVGVITDRDIKRASASSASQLEMHELLSTLTKVKIREILTPNPITVPHDYTIEEAAEILFNNKISGLPVVDEMNHVVGVITKNDIFRVLMDLTGLKKKGIQFALKVEDHPKAINTLTEVIRQCGGRIVSILTSGSTTHDGYRHIYIRAFDVDTAHLKILEDQLSQKATILYIVDHDQNKRQIFT